MTNQTLFKSSLEGNLLLLRGGFGPSYPVALQVLRTLLVPLLVALNADWVPQINL